MKAGTLTPLENLRFLDTKRKLIQPLIDRAEAHMLELTFSHLTRQSLDQLSAEEQQRGWRAIDRKLEKLIVEGVLDEDAAAIRRQLKVQFGFSSVGNQPGVLLRRIMRTREIRNEEEAELVDNFLSGDYLGWAAPEKERQKLNTILATFKKPQGS